MDITITFDDTTYLIPVNATHHTKIKPDQGGRWSVQLIDESVMGSDMVEEHRFTSRMGAQTTYDSFVFWLSMHSDDQGRTHVPNSSSEPFWISEHYMYNKVQLVNLDTGKIEDQYVSPNPLR